MVVVIRVIKKPQELTFQMSSWLSAVLEILRCDHVHVVCQSEVTVT